MLNEYPDARFVQTHRDPLKMLASLTSLVTHLRKMASDEVDPQAIALEWAQWNALGLNASAEFRASGRIPADRVIDIDFYAFMEDPLAQIHQLYEAFGFDLDADTRTAMANYLAVHNAQQHGAHRYDFADTGLDYATERARVAPYQSQFATRQEF